MVNGVYIVHKNARLTLEEGYA